MELNKIISVADQKVGQMYAWVEGKLKASAPKLHEKVKGFFQYMEKNAMQRLALTGFFAIVIVSNVFSAVFAPSTEDIIREATESANKQIAAQIADANKRGEQAIKARQIQLQEIEAKQKASKAKKQAAAAAKKVKQKKPHLETGGGYSTITPADVRKLGNKTVYVAVTTLLKGIKKRLDDEYVFAGEPVTLYNNYKNSWVTIKTQKGLKAQIQLHNLSKTPLKYNLLNVKDGEQLVQDILVDVYDITAVRLKKTEGIKKPKSFGLRYNSGYRDSN